MTSDPASDQKDISLAIIGAGLIGIRHVEAIARVDGVRVGCIVDPLGRDFADGKGMNWYASITDMLAAEKPDGAIIATPNQMHVVNGLECISAGVPILVEKPIADNADAAKTLVKAGRAANVPVLVGHHRRHNPLIKAAKNQIESGAIGEIVAVHASCWLYKPDDYFDVDWRTKPGAGPIFINLVHDIDLLRYLVGEVTEVQALQSNATRGHAVEDSAVVILRFDNGALATITVSDTIVAPWSWELTATENPAYPSTRQSCYLIGGTKGSLEIPTGRIWSQSEPRSWWRPIDRETRLVEPSDPLDAQIVNFCDVIAGKAEPVVSGAEGLASLKVIEEIKSATTNRNSFNLG